MVDIKKLKLDIENNSPIDSFYIFKYSDNTFVANQYIKKIANNKNLNIVYVDDLKSLLPDLNDIFGVSELVDEKSLYIYLTDTFDSTDVQIKNIINLIVVCNKLGDESKETFSPYIVEIPKLEDWQIKDYIYSKGEGIADYKLDWLCANAKNDIYRLDNEIQKLTLFSKGERDQLFEIFAEEDMYSDLSDHHTFDLSSELLQKDINRVAELLVDKDKWDSDPLPLNILLGKNFKQVLQIQSSPNITAEKLGLNSRQFYAISKNNCGHYTKDQLLQIFDVVTRSDYMMKNGELPLSLFLDYMIINILSV